MTDFENFEPPKYDPMQENTPVDVFDIPASQRRLAQPTPLRPYNGFTLLGLGLSIIGVIAIGLTFLVLWAVKSPVFGMSYGVSLLVGAMFGVPAVLCCLIALYQLSFTGFEKGKAVTWLGLVLGFLLLTMSIFSGFVLCYWLNEVIVVLMKYAADAQRLFS